MAYIRQVAKDTYTIETPRMTVPFYRINQSDIILMDSGIYNEGDDMSECLDKAGFHIKSIITSHVHYDHIGNHLRFQEQFSSKIYMTHFDSAITDSYIKLRSCFSGYSAGEIKRLFPYMRLKADATFDPDCARLEVDGASFEILHLCGHALDHICIVTPDNTIYAGDQLMSQNILKKITWIYNDDPGRVLENITILSKSDYPVCICAHRGVENDLKELSLANANALQNQIDKVLEVIDDWSSFDEICRKVPSHNLSEISAQYVLSRILRGIIFHLTDTCQLKMKVQNNILYYKRET